ncbi:MAG: IPT/TIG domain-containing protein [Actinomycetota bacterium]|nr:IPT/TIG domain-containing protein [Actinomycetota bacterium]
MSATWDDTGALLSYAVPASAPVVNPTFSAFDSYGNELYNASNNAYLLLAPTFVPTPRVTSLSVTVGPANGGTSVTIGGTGFTGATAVAFGGQPAASFAVNGDNSIAAVTPVAAGGTITVTVTTSGGTSGAIANAQFTFVGPPVVSGISPKSGLVTGGNSVTITGASLTYVSAVSFGETATSFVVNSDTSITAIAPYYDAPDTVNIKLTSLGGSNAPTSASRYSYKTYEQVMPASGPSTTSVTVSGGGFSPGEPVTASYKTALAAPSPAWVTVCTGHAAPDGTFSCGGPIPGAPTAGASGSHTIRAKGGHSRFTASTIFTLR